MGHAPENTIESFEKAIALDCDELETDVWLMEAGGLVTSHDRPAADATHPSLADVLELCRGRIAVNVELKSERHDGLARRTGAAAASLIAANPDTEAYVSSFWWSALDGARGAAPTVRRAFVFSDSPDPIALIASARELGLWALHPDRTYVTPELIAAAHDAGLRVNAWTVNEPNEIAAFAALGVDGIMSDWPERIPRGQPRA